MLIEIKTKLILYFITFFTFINQIKLDHDIGCAKKRLANILHSKLRLEITCQASKLCVLKSNACAKEEGNFLRWKRQLRHQTLNDLIIIGKKIKKFRLDSASLDLRIRKIEKSDEGIYEEFLNQSTLISKYYVSVVENLNHYPVHMNDVEIVKNLKLASIRILRKHNPNLNISYELGEWSKCRCVDSANKGFRTRLDKCFFIQKSTKKTRKRSNFEKFVLSKVDYFSGKIECKSQLIISEYAKEILLDYKLENYEIFDDCECSNLTKNYTNNPNDLLLGLPEIKILHVKTGESLRLDCMYHEDSDWLNIFWRFDVITISNFDFTQRIFMDHVFRLNIKQFDKSDLQFSNFSCFIDGKIRSIYSIKLNNDGAQSLDLTFVVTYFGLSVFLISLFIIIFLSSIQPKIKLN